MSLQTIETKIAKVIHHEPSKWSGKHFLIGRTMEGVTIKGEMQRRPDSLSTYRLWGEWKEDTRCDGGKARQLRNWKGRRVVGDVTEHQGKRQIGLFSYRLAQKGVDTKVQSHLPGTTSPAPTKPLPAFDEFGPSPQTSTTGVESL